MKKLLEWKPVRFGLEVGELYFSKRVSRSAAELAYFLILTFFPVLICINAFIGLLHLDINAVLEAASTFLPRETLGILGDYIQYITGNAEVNPTKDLTLIACLQDNGFSTLAVPADAPYDDFAGFVEYAKAHPGELNAGMPAAGANTFLFGMLTSATGIELNSVECASESDRLTNLAGGFIDIGVVGVGNALEYEKAGKLKVIGTVSSDGNTISMYPEELPDNYKTLQEQGFEDCVLYVNHYLYGPAGMDETMVKEMNAAMQAVCVDETVSEGIASIGNIPGWHDLEESKKIRDEEYASFVEIAKELDLYVQE